MITAGFDQNVTYSFNKIKKTIIIIKHFDKARTFSLKTEPGALSYCFIDIGNTILCLYYTIF